MRSKWILFGCAASVLALGACTGTEESQEEEEIVDLRPGPNNMMASNNNTVANNDNTVVNNDTPDPNNTTTPDPNNNTMPEAKVPEFGLEDSRAFTVLGDQGNGLNVPRDLQFNPDRPTELWTINRANDGTVLFFDAGTADQSSELIIDVYANHFMEEPAALAFGATGTFGTCQESNNTYNGQAAPNNFMGPSLWPSDLSIYAKVNQGNNELGGSHLDMLHQSPFCMGIAHEKDNVYWVFDGHNGHLVRYDFGDDHGPGYDDHSDGVIRRYPEATVMRVPDIPSHMEIDKQTGWIYVADTGNKRIFRMDTTGGQMMRQLQLTNEPLAEFSAFAGATIEILADSNLQQPSGLVLGQDRFFVSDASTNEIIAYTLTGEEIERIQTPAKRIAGLELGPQGKLWYVDQQANELVRIDSE